MRMVFKKREMSLGQTVLKSESTQSFLLRRSFVVFYLGGVIAAT